MKQTKNEVLIQDAASTLVQLASKPSQDESSPSDLLDIGHLERETVSLFEQHVLEPFLLESCKNVNGTSPIVFDDVFSHVKCIKKCGSFLCKADNSQLLVGVPYGKTAVSQLEQGRTYTTVSGEYRFYVHKISHQGSLGMRPTPVEDGECLDPRRITLTLSIDHMDQSLNETRAVDNSKTMSLVLFRSMKLQNGDRKQLLQINGPLTGEEVDDFLKHFMSEVMITPIEWKEGSSIYGVTDSVLLHEQGWGLDTSVLTELTDAKVLQNFAIVLNVDIECSFSTLDEACSVFSCLPAAEQARASRRFLDWIVSNTQGGRKHWRRKILEDFDEAVLQHELDIKNSKFRSTILKGLGKRQTATLHRTGILQMQMVRRPRELRVAVARKLVELHRAAMSNGCGQPLFVPLALRHNRCLKRRILSSPAADPMASAKAEKGQQCQAGSAFKLQNLGQASSGLPISALVSPEPSTEETRSAKRMKLSSQPLQTTWEPYLQPKLSQDLQAAASLCSPITVPLMLPGWIELVPQMLPMYTFQPRASDLAELLLSQSDLLRASAIDISAIAQLKQ
ncbi:hypothetical protein GUITHDRAFT_147535 [Guillardia theta CCMP2712]|uniref:Uncharacterized protein n=1 Tax=Guillardia theta (strain CCMP2712) TaxID=905079 RepID=L1IDG5_GUITC|nr:hypothetical protein GUITHDRAFT_147535 [Guillardia theta CCMP2712]EKX33959.1 hypothetical protein GUITHDRAFT_147535 [Guillardia theta CCMP2712]|eukprot:XP_005820939.1 hypothetical protein GUITHDRAFT_147535 [Guillardia theta CCMP2712]